MRKIGAVTTCCVCGDTIVLYTGEKLWYHLDGTLYCCDLNRINLYLSQVAQEDDGYLARRGTGTNAIQ